MPEANLLDSDGRKAQIISALGPGDVGDRIATAIHRQQALLALNVVDGHTMVVRLVGSCHVAAARRQGAGGNAS